MNLNTEKSNNNSSSTTNNLHPSSNLLGIERSPATTTKHPPSRSSQIRPASPLTRKMNLTAMTTPSQEKKTSNLHQIKKNHKLYNHPQLSLEHPCAKEVPNHRRCDDLTLWSLTKTITNFNNQPSANHQS